MTEKTFEYEDRPGEPCDVLHINLRIPHRILPAESRKHLRAASREMLLAVRSLVDGAIERHDRREAHIQE